MKKIVILFIIVSAACKEGYVPPIVSSNNRYLVVEGFINNGPDSTVFQLTRSYKLDDSASLQPELHAGLSVEGKDNSVYPIAELGNGRYATPGLYLNNAVQYRLHIHTSDGKQYVSDYVDLKTSPPIDSISWVRNDDGLQISANSHDPQNASHYYRWDYEQTWEFHSILFSNFEFGKDSAIHPRTENIFFTCWKSANSTNILLYSSARLSQDVASFPLLLIPSNSWEISIKYSILVKQYVLTPEAYQFWADLQKNSEQIGSIFSPEPSGSKGNIHQVGDTSALVIGYVSAGTMRQQRIFIEPFDIPGGWQYNPYRLGCDPISIVNRKDSLFSWLGGPGFLPVGPTLGYPPGARWDIALASCVDCTLTGTNIKPVFWP